MRGWRWGDDWAKIDAIGTVYSEDDSDNGIEKYMDLQLYDSEGEPIIPIRIDHFEVIYDGDPIPADKRALIASAPALLEALEKLCFWVDNDLPEMRRYQGLTAATGNLANRVREARETIAQAKECASTTAQQGDA